MKPKFSDLTPEQQKTFGNGCTFVPDFHYTANCRQHDYSYVRRGGLKDKLKADWDMCRLMWSDSYLWWHYIISVCYWVGLTVLPFSYFFFEWGKYRTNQEILKRDAEIKRVL